MSALLVRFPQIVSPQDNAANIFTDYAALEVLAGKSYHGKEQDVWALGILLYTLVYKESLFYNVDEILDASCASLGS
jgi:hypothetical protein